MLITDEELKAIFRTNDYTTYVPKYDARMATTEENKVHIAAMSSTSRPTQSHSRTKPVFPIAKRIGRSSRTDMSQSLIERPLSKYRS